MKQIKFACDDRYEAEKLASLLSVQKDGRTFVEGVTAIIDDNKEIVVRLKDKSSHSVVMQDHQNLNELGNLLESLEAGKIEIFSSIFENNVVLIKIDESSN